MAPTLAFAGSGRITIVHGLAAQQLGLDVRHVASRDRAHAEERARQMGATACDYEQLPAGADAVVVATPPVRHAADALRALSAGAAVLVEKPMCATLAEADELVARSESSGAPLGYAENLAFAPIVVAAIELAGTIGEVRYIEARALQERPDWGAFTTAGWGGGVLFDLGVHPLAVVMLLAGSARVVEVRAELASSPDIDVDDRADVDLLFDSGLRARVTTSWRADTPIWDAQASSDGGVVRAELLPHLALEHNGEPVTMASPPVMEFPQLSQFGYIGQLASFTADVAARRQPRVGARFGRDVLDVVCAAYASAGQDGAPVTTPFAGPRDRTPLQLWRG